MSVQVRVAGRWVAQEKAVAVKTQAQDATEGRR